MILSIHGSLWGPTFTTKQADHPQYLSIHGPLWSPTELLEQVGYDVLLSIHGPLWGPTTAAARRTARFFPFNPRAPCGARPREIAVFAPRPTFNPRAPVGPDAMGGVFTAPHIAFNPRAPVRPDAADLIRPGTQLSFNPRAPVGPDTAIHRQDFVHGFAFNPRAPVGPDPADLPAAAASRVFQSTGPCGARRGALYARAPAVRLSIHGPLWGPTSLATQTPTMLLPFNPRAPVGPDAARGSWSLLTPFFQSTGPCGARRVELEVWYKYCPFQSTGPCGARPDRGRIIRDAHALSIHGPLWGPTRGPLSGQLLQRTFNPRAPVGPDAPIVLINVLDPAFQSTGPCGARHQDGWRLWGNYTFNPRAPVGPDSGQFSRSQQREDFQSTGPCGARHQQGRLPGERSALSIHGPLWGPTPPRMYSIGRPPFQSTGPCGARRPIPKGHLVFADLSIHGPLWGPTKFGPDGTCYGRSFNPRAPVGPDSSQIRHCPVVRLNFQSTGPCGARRSRHGLLIKP